MEAQVREYEVRRHMRSYLKYNAQIEHESNGGLWAIKGRCRRHAPTMTGYPVVFENDSCGDHKLA